MGRNFIPLNAPMTPFGPLLCTQPMFPMASLGENPGGRVTADRVWRPSALSQISDTLAASVVGTGGPCHPSE